MPRLIVCCLFLTAFSLFFHSCTKKDSFTLDFQYDYAPVDSGHYVIYDVDSITYTNNGVQRNDTAHYQLMELVTDTMYDGVNEIAHVLDLYRSNDSGTTWVFDRKWTVKRTVTTYQKTEDDIKFIKLVFPPETGKEWNGNLYVSKDDPFEQYLDWTYYYENEGVPYSINGFNFDSTLSVLEVDAVDLLSKRLRREVYAKGVGMIYQEYEMLQAASGVINPNWYTGDITGHRIQMRVRAYN